jgi:hypothetical protein
MANGIDTPMNTAELPPRDPVLYRPSPHAERQELLATDNAMLGLSELTNTVVNLTRRRYSMPNLGNRRLVRHGAHGGGPLRTSGAQDASNAQRKRRLQPAVTASGFDPLK